MQKAGLSATAHHAVRCTLFYQQESEKIKYFCIQEQKTQKGASTLADERSFSTLAIGLWPLLTMDGSGISKRVTCCNPAIGLWPLLTKSESEAQGEV